MAVVECEDRVVRSEAAFKLREAVTWQRDARIIVLDLSEVRAIESSGLGMLVFSAAMGVRPRHSTEAIQSHQIRFIANPARSIAVPV